MCVLRDKKLWAFIASLCALLVTSYGTSADVERERVQRALETAEYHHMALSRSLEHLDTLLPAVVHIDPLTRQRRQVLQATLAESYTSFCLTLLSRTQKSSPVTPMPTTPTGFASPLAQNLPPEPDEMVPSARYPPDIPNFQPISVNIKSFPGFSNVTFEVKHKVPILVAPYLNRMDIGNVKEIYLEMRPDEPVPKVSSVTFRVQTDWCSKYISEPGVDFIFYIPTWETSRTVASVKVCKGGTWVGSPSDPARLPQEMMIHFNTSGNELTARKGHNLTLMAEVSLAPQNVYGMTIRISTRSFNPRNRILSFANSVIYTFENMVIVGKDPEYPSKHNTNFTTFQLNSTYDTNADPVSSEMVKMVLDTATNDQIAYIGIEQLNYNSDGSMLKYIKTTYPLLISQQGENDGRIPAGVLSFMPTEQRQLCNTNTFDYTYSFQADDCIVRCSIFGRDILSLDIVRVEHEGTPTVMSEEIELSPWNREAMLRVDPKTSLAHAKYGCRATLKGSGRVFSQEIDLYVIGVPNINSTATRVVRTGPDTVTVYCVATGTNLNVTIVKGEGDWSQNGTPVFTRLDDNPRYTKQVDTGDNFVHLALEMPSEEVMFDDFHHMLCNASNIYDKVEFYFYSIQNP